MSELGFTSKDLWFIFLCIVFATLGSLTQALINHWGNLRQAPRSAPEGRGRAAGLHVALWILARLFVGATLGLVFSLFMIGALADGAQALARALGLSILIGYSAPVIWQRHIEQYTEAFVETVASKGGKKT